MNTPVNYPIAKLLKEKGFVCIKSDNFWMNGFSYPKKDYNPITYQDKDNVATISDVVMWLYEKHGIWIWVERYSTMFRPYAEEIGEERFGKWEGHKYNTPVHAYEACFLHILNLKKNILTKTK